MSTYTTDADDEDFGDVPDPNLSNEQLRQMLDQESQLTMGHTGAGSPDSRDSLDALYGNVNSNKGIDGKRGFPLTALKDSERLDAGHRANNLSAISNISDISAISNVSNNSNTRQGNPNRATAMTNLGMRDGFNPHNLASRNNKKLVTDSDAPNDYTKFTIPNENNDTLMGNGNSNKNNENGKYDIAQAKPLKVKNKVDKVDTIKSQKEKFDKKGGWTSQHSESIASENENGKTGVYDDKVEAPPKSLRFGMKKSNSNGNGIGNGNVHRDTQFSSTSTVGGRYFGARDSTYDGRSSQSTTVTHAQFKNQLSFAKLDLANNGKGTKKSALSAAIQSKRGGNSSSVNNTSNGSSQQFKDKSGNLVIQQLPFNQKNMFKCNLFIEISEDDTVSCLVFFDKKFTGSQFIDFMKKEFNNGALANSSVELYVADEDGDIDDDYPQPESDQVLSKMGLTNFYFKIENVDSTDRQTIANDVRQSIGNMNSLSDLPDIDDGDEYMPDGIDLNNSNQRLGNESTQHQKTADRTQSGGCCVLL